MTLTAIMKFALVAATSTIISTPAAAENELDRRTAIELNACVVAIRDSVDLDSVNRIRHVVTRTKPAYLGRAFSVETSTFADGIERRYDVYCVANGNNPPLTLRVKEIQT